MIYNKEVRYFLYARKSSESEDRQIQSIDDQVNRLEELAKSRRLKIVHVYRESKSAKKPNNRPLFEEMINRINKGEANGILCWQINRLSRNPKDSGDIQWLLQSGKIDSIQTYDREYLPDDNALLLSVESGMSNQFILDLSKNVKRGLQSKLDKGWRPGMAPNGYINELYDHTIIPDGERFVLMRKAWDVMLTGNYTVPTILNMLNNEWGFRTLKKRRIGNNPMSMSGLYKMFTNEFYAGLINHKGKLYNGKHEPMVTLEEYDRVQMLLGSKGKPRPKKHTFPFTGLIRCGHCGCLITAETKTKFIKSRNIIRGYTYYHCTKQKVGIKCDQPSLTAPELDQQIISELSKLTISPKLKNWVLDILQSSTDNEVEERTKTYEMLQSSVNEKQRQLDNLTKMRIRELISDSEFTTTRDELQNELVKLRTSLQDTERRADTWIEAAERALNFACNASMAFEVGDINTKREILRTIGSEFILLDKKLNFKPNPWVKIIIDSNEEKPTLELPIIGLDKRKTGDFSPALLRWHGVKESNPRHRFWRPTYYHYTNPAKSELKNNFEL